jgi:hypothetical protein
MVMLIVTDLSKLPMYGFTPLLDRMNENGWQIYERTVKLLGYGEECAMDLVVNPRGSEYQTENQLIQCVSYNQDFESMKAELEAIGAEDFTFDEEFPADLLMRMVMDGVVAYVP